MGDNTSNDPIGYFLKVSWIYHYVPPIIDLESFMIEFEKLILNYEVKAGNLVNFWILKVKLVWKWFLEFWVPKWNFVSFVSPKMWNLSCESCRFQFLSLLEDLRS